MFGHQDSKNNKADKSLIAPTTIAPTADNSDDDLAVSEVETALAASSSDNGDKKNSDKSSDKNAKPSTSPSSSDATSAPVTPLDLTGLDELAKDLDAMTIPTPAKTSSDTSSSDVTSTLKNADKTDTKGVSKVSLPEPTIAVPAPTPAPATRPASPSSSAAPASAPLSNAATTSTGSFSSTPAPRPAPAVSTSPSVSPGLGIAPNPSAAAPVVSGDLNELKLTVLHELSPLVDHLDQTAEEHFRTLMMMIQSAEDHGLLPKAYEAAHNIQDAKVRAQALLDVVNEISYFTQQPTAAE